MPSPSPVPTAGLIEGADEVTSQRYRVLTALKAPQNLPQHDEACGLQIGLACLRAG